MRKRMVLDRIPYRFCEGPFWGNGEMGAVMYVREGKLCISLDHAGLWELRETLPDFPRADFRKILENKDAYVREDTSVVENMNIFDTQIGRVRLPAMAVELTLPGRITRFRAETDLEKAETKLLLLLDGSREVKGRIWLDSNVNVFYMEFAGMDGKKVSANAVGWDLDSPRLTVLKNWDYKPCVRKMQEGCSILKQHFGGDRSAVLCMRELSDEEGIRFAAGVTTAECCRENQLEAESVLLLTDYLERTAAYRLAHEKDWEKYWSGFDMLIPEERLMEAFWQEMYKLYCNEREYAAPVTLQGVWNQDGRMPAWWGDLHNDLNVQSCYWPAYKTGNVKLVRPYVDTYFKAMPRFMERAEKLFGMKDAVHVPTMMTPDGTGAASEWGYWNTILGPELFVAVDFTWFYEYSRETDTLREKIVPFIEKVLHLYQGLAFEKEDGFLHIPFTVSPEVNKDGHMLMEDDATFTLSCLHYLCFKMASYAEILGEDGERFLAWESRLAPVRPNEKGYPLFPGIDVFGSHRHFCQMFPIFPLCEEAHNEVANRSLDTAVNQGFLEYAAFSFPYMGIMAARCGRGNMCRTMLEIYCMAFRSRNSFTVNGDPYQNGVLRVSGTNAGESADTFTLESGLFVPTVLCEMFVHRAKENIWLMMGIPDEWKTGSCRGLTVEGGHRICLERENYCLKKAVLQAACQDEMTIRWKDEAALIRVIKDGDDVTAVYKNRTEKAACRIEVHAGEEWILEFAENELPAVRECGFKAVDGLK